MSNTLQQSFTDGLHLRRVPAEDQRSSPTLVCLHGLGESGLCFERLLLDLRFGDWNRCAIDLPGYGKSPWSKLAATFDEVASHLRAWLTTNLIGEFVLLGHSMGGVIGTRLIAGLDQMPMAFVNVEGNISLADCTGSLEISRYDREAFCSRGFFEFADQIYTFGVDSPALRGYYASLRMSNPVKLHRDSLELIELSKAEGLANEMGQLEVPKLYLLGDPGGAGERSRQLLDASSVSWRGIPESGHWPFIDQHDRFAQELLGFLQGIRAGD